MVLTFILCTMKQAIWACYRRSLEMGGHSSDVGPGRMHQSPNTETKIIHHHHHDVPSGEMKNNDSDSDDEETPKKL